MNYGSVCSGIEAATVAWSPLGWSADWLAEIETFPSAVLAHHYPEVSNLGDMTTIAAKVLTGAVAAPDVLVGGTPCQAFSVAGMRQGLADARGQLTIKYVELADAIDLIRLRAGKPATITVWENVPGVLSDKQNAFGCFLGALAGEDSELQPSGEKWTNAGCVYGPKRAIAWRVLDAQYFGVAQRRRRVFVIASAREDFDPAAVLFEREGLRRDTAPSRGKGQETAGTLDARTSGGGFPGADGACSGHVQPVPILEPGARTGRSTTDQRAGLGVGKSGDPMFTLQAGKQHGVAVCPTLRAGGNTTGGHRPPGTDVDTADSLIVTAVTGDITHTLNAANNGKGCSEDGTGRGVPTIAFDTTCITSRSNRSNPQPDGPCHTLAAGAHAPAIVRTVALRGRDGGATAELGGDVATALRASNGGGDKPHVIAFQPGNLRRGAGADPSEQVFPTVKADHGRGLSDQFPHVASSLAVRRLTPVECERLQGFPDDYTNVPYRNKTAADGPRYKAIGNSMAVPVMHWIGQRIQEQFA